MDPLIMELYVVLENKQNSSSNNWLLVFENISSVSY